jgi:DNA-binding CsgD family transcriptional regulator
MHRDRSHLQDSRHKRIRPYKRAEPGQPLTARELQVLDAVMAGDGTMATAAQTLGVTESTVKNHLTVVRQKFGVRTTLAACLMRREGHV